MKKHHRKKIIAAIDESDNAPAVIASASEIAESTSADVVVVSVIEVPRLVASEGEVERAQIEAEERRISEHQKKLIDIYFSGSDALVESRILHGEPAEKICELADKSRADLVIIGTRGLGKLESKLIGSISEKVVKNCPCSVLLVRKR
ncbi:MAG: universal stress protein [Nitrososphaerales archaeon]